MKVFKFKAETLREATGRAYDAANSGVYYETNYDAKGNVDFRELEVETGDLLFCEGEDGQWAMAVAYAWPICEWHNGETGEFHTIEGTRGQFLDSSTKYTSDDKLAAGFLNGDNFVLENGLKTAGRGGVA